MSLAPGTRLGPYEITAPLGAGGMGEVYCARDTRLERSVAIKLLPSLRCADATAKRRFEQEARAISSLNHPNICALYDVGEETGTPYLVMEYLEGETLAQRLQKGMLPLVDALPIAIAIADAMNFAHTNGIIHRDMKAANLYLTRRNEAKILDFGLAKRFSTVDACAASTVAPGSTFDVAPQLTSPGTVVGTIDYMSPEQARGEKVDFRTDLYSFGVVLYEMMTGKRPFVGVTPAVVFDAILNRQPLSPSILNTAIPLSMERLIIRLLAKDRSARVQTASGLLDELRKIEFERTTIEQSFSKRQATSSIAVLPFEDLSADRSQQPFCEGVAAEIINALGEIEGLRVISRTSSVHCRERGMGISEIGGHLNVQTILEGTVRKSGARLRMTVQLVDSRDGVQIWSDRYDRKEGDVFDIQEEIARSIVRKLKGTLMSGESLNVKRVTDSVEAYKLYLKARYFWERRNRVALQSAMTYFEQAISADPNFALPHAGLADCYTILGNYSIRPTYDVQPKALRLAERALELDPDLPEGNVSLAAVKHFLEWDWTSANRYYTRAIELNPRLAIARSWRATLLLITGTKSPDPLTESVDAMKLEPDSGGIAYIAGINHYWGGDVDTAGALIDRAIELEPMAVFAHWVRASVFSVKGLHEEAISTTLRATSAANHHPLLVSALGAAYARAGRVGDANDLIKELQSRSGREYIAPQYIAEIHLALGHSEQACDWFERAVNEHNPLIIGLGTAPHYAPLRHEARFRAILRRMNLPD